MTSATERKTAGIELSEALLMVRDVGKQVKATRLLQPNVYNDFAVKTLLTCYNSMVMQIPGAEIEVIVNTQATPTATPTTAYKQQIKQGQTIFAAPENGKNSPADEPGSSLTNDYRS